MSDYFETMYEYLGKTKGKKRREREMLMDPTEDMLDRIKKNLNPADYKDIKKAKMSRFKGYLGK